MFRNSGPRLSDLTVSSFREHLLLLLNSEQKHFSVSVELRPLQILLLQGISEFILSTNLLSEEHQSELSLAIGELTDGLRSIYLELPSTDIAQENFFPMLRLLHELQLLEIDDDDEESEDNDDEYPGEFS